jgi:chlorobactene glucosyltransferase
MLIIALVAALIWTAMALAVVSHSLKNHYLKAYEGSIPANSPTVDVIIPALNEELRLQTTIEKVLAQEYPNLTVTVINDRSTDRTGEILDELARTKPIRVIHGQPRPIGWVGKTWAIVQGTKGAEAEWLLFVDADMTLHPRALASAMHQANEVGADLVSIIARPEIESFWQAAIAITLGEVLFTMYPIHKINDPKSKVALAAGGFALIRRSAYEKIGGHEAVRAEIAEDIKLGQVMKRAGFRLSVHMAPTLASTHMYGTFRELWMGLRKNAFAGMEYKYLTFVTGAVGGQIMAWTPPIAIVLGLFTGSWLLAAVGAWGWLAQALSVAPIIPYLRISPLYVFTIPLGSAAYTAIATASVWNHLRGRIIWKGVTFSAKEVQEASRPARAAVGASSMVEVESDPVTPATVLSDRP